MKGKVKPDITESQRLVSIPCICVYNFYCVSIVYKFYTGCTAVAPDIKMEGRLAISGDETCWAKDAQHQ